MFGGEASDGPQPKYECFCEEWEVPKVSQSEANPGRTFFSCLLDAGKKKEDPDRLGCQWFRWEGGAKPKYAKYAEKRKAAKQRQQEKSDQVSSKRSPPPYRSPTLQHPDRPRKQLKRSHSPSEQSSYQTTDGFVNARTGAPVGGGAGHDTTTSTRSALSYTRGRMEPSATPVDDESVWRRSVASSLQRLVDAMDTLVRQNLEMATAVDNVMLDQAEMANTLVKMEKRYQEQQHQQHQQDDQQQSEYSQSVA